LRSLNILNIIILTNKNNNKYSTTKNQLRVASFKNGPGFGDFDFARLRGKFADPESQGG
jgi:hypothetical protein